MYMHSDSNKIMIAENTYIRIKLMQCNSSVIVFLF